MQVATLAIIYLYNHPPVSMLQTFEAMQMLDIDMVERRAIPALPDKPNAGTVYLV